MIYEPEEDSYLLEEQVKIYSPNKNFLDMGTATGIQSEAAINSKAKSILAVDINPKVIALLKKKKIPCIKSDLFEKIKGKFDLIAFNPPYLPEDKLEDSESKQITSGGKNGDEIILRFLNQSLAHLNKKGIILLVISSLTPKKRILALLKKQKLSKKSISQKKLFMEKLGIWEIKKELQ